MGTLAPDVMAIVHPVTVAGMGTGLLSDCGGGGHGFGAARRPPFCTDRQDPLAGREVVA